MPKFNGNLDTVDLGSDPSASTGTVYFNTTSNAFKFYNGSSWVTIGQQTVVEAPTGSIIHWIGSKASIPSGWLACDGTSYSTATYPDLYGVISVYFGGTPGSSFNVPDLRSVALPMRTSGLAGVAVGNTGGGTYTWTFGTADPFGPLTHSSDSAAHTHTWTDDSQGAHTHAYDHSHTLGATFSSDGDHSHTRTDSVSTDGHSHTLGNTGAASGTTSASSTGIYDASSTTHTHSPANITGGNSHTHTTTESSTTNGAHTASSHGASGTHSSATGTTSTSGGHTHGGTASADAAAAHTHTDHDPKMARVHFIIKT